MPCTCWDMLTRLLSEQRKGKCFIDFLQWVNLVLSPGRGHNFKRILPSCEPASWLWGLHSSVVRIIQTYQTLLLTLSPWQNLLTLWLDPTLITGLKDFQWLSFYPTHVKLLEVPGTGVRVSLPFGHPVSYLRRSMQQQQQQQQHCKVYFEPICLMFFLQDFSLHNLKFSIKRN